MFNTVRRSLNAGSATVADEPLVKSTNAQQQLAQRSQSSAAASVSKLVAFLAGEDQAQRAKYADMQGKHFEGLEKEFEVLKSTFKPYLQLGSV